MQQEHPVGSAGGNDQTLVYAAPAEDQTLKIMRNSGEQETMQQEHPVGSAGGDDQTLVYAAPAEDQTLKYLGGDGDRTLAGNSQAEGVHEGGPSLRPAKKRVTKKRVVLESDEEDKDSEDEDSEEGSEHAVEDLMSVGFNPLDGTPVAQVLWADGSNTWESLNTMQLQEAYQERLRLLWEEAGVGKKRMLLGESVCSQ